MGKITIIGTHRGKGATTMLLKELHDKVGKDNKVAMVTVGDMRYHETNLREMKHFSSGIIAHHADTEDWVGYIKGVMEQDQYDIIGVDLNVTPHPAWFDLARSINRQDIFIACSL